MKFRAALTLVIAIASQTCLAATPREAGAWWGKFDDPVLRAFVGEATGGMPADSSARLRAEASLAGEYAIARLSTVRMALAADASAAAQQLVPILERSAAAPEELRAAKLSLARANTRLQHLGLRRRASIELLANVGQGAFTPRVTAAILQPAGAQALPWPEFEPIEQVPGIVLRHRPEVALRESRLGQDPSGSHWEVAKYIQALSTPIIPTPSAPGEYADPFDQVRAEVGMQLWKLNMAIAAAQRQMTTLEQLSQEFSNLRVTAAAGAWTPPQELFAQIALVEAQDGLLEALGEVVLSWIGFQLSVGGCGDPTMESLLGVQRGD